MINLDLKLKRQKLVSPVFHQWKHYHDFTSYCACAFPTAVFAGGFCGQCNYRPSSSRRGASAVSNKQKMREKTEGAVNVKLLYPYEDTALQRTAERDRQELAIAPIRQNRLPGGILVPFAKARHDKEGSFDTSVTFATNKEFASATVIDVTSTWPIVQNEHVCPGKATSGKGIAKSRNIAIPRNRLRLQDESLDHGRPSIVSKTEQKELREMYDLATWRMFYRITKYRQERGIVIPPQEYHFAANNLRQTDTGKEEEYDSTRDASMDSNDEKRLAEHDLYGEIFDFEL